MTAERLADTALIDDAARPVAADPRNLTGIDADSGRVGGAIGRDMVWQGTISIEGASVYKPRTERSSPATRPQAGLAVPEVRKG